MSLTEIKVRQAKPKEKIYFLADDDGLSLKVEPNGRKSWSYRYSLTGTNKRPRMKLGEYPVMSLKEPDQSGMNINLIIMKINHCIKIHQNFSGYL